MSGHEVMISMNHETRVLLRYTTTHSSFQFSRTWCCRHTRIMNVIMKRNRLINGCDSFSFCRTARWMLFTRLLPSLNALKRLWMYFFNFREINNKKTLQADETAVALLPNMRPIIRRTCLDLK